MQWLQLLLPLDNSWCISFPFPIRFVFAGWNGKHCTLEGCPKGCSGHGQCKTNHALEWECWCESGWFGPGCDIPMERDCSDRRDNDQGKITMYYSNCFLANFDI